MQRLFYNGNNKKDLNYSLFFKEHILMLNEVIGISINEFIEKKDYYKRKYYLTSLHNHSTFSDGELTPNQIIKGAFANKYDIISITDHNNDYAFLEIFNNNYKLSHYFTIEQINSYTIKITNIKKNNKIINYEKSDANNINNKDDNSAEILYLIKGEEITTKENYHIISIAHESHIESKRSLEETIQNLIKNKAIIIFPHPLVKISSGVGLENIIKYKDKVNAIEINGRVVFPFKHYNKKVKKVGEKYKIPVISAPDAHRKDFYFNTFLTLVEKDGFDPKNIKGYLIEKIRNNCFLIQDNYSSFFKMWKDYIRIAYNSIIIKKS